MSFHSQGSHTAQISMKMFKNNRNRVVQALRDTKKIKNEQSTFVILQGGTEDAFGFYDTDITQTTFRQESYFQYLFGVSEPDFFGVIRVSDGHTILFAPRLDKEYEVWMGPIPTTDNVKTRYEVDEAFYVDELVKILSDRNSSLLLTLSSINSDSGKLYSPPTFPGIEKFPQDADLLYPVIAECRVIKSPEEIEVLRYVNAFLTVF